jgi:sugar phosphate isomerase/epimerase
MSELKWADRMHRRRFFGTVAAAGFGGLVLSACGRPDSVRAAGGAIDRIGLQLYTVRDRMQQDVAATLRTVGEVGYSEVETAGLFGHSPAQFRDLLDQAGLVSPAAHVQLNELRDDQEATFATAQTIGQRWLIVPWLEQGMRTPEGYQRVAAELNQAGAAAAQRGLRVGYHNHEFEFEALAGGRSGYDILLDETDAELVDMELDLYWAVHAGHDPVNLFERHPGRFRLCHVKDMADPQGEMRMVAVGEGDIDFARIFGHAENAGLEHFFVEHDNPDDSLESIRTSFGNLRQLSFQPASG